jgi:hypothetical protein
VGLNSQQQQQHTMVLLVLRFALSLHSVYRLRSHNTLQLVNSTPNPLMDAHHACGKQARACEHEQASQ